MTVDDELIEIGHDLMTRYLRWLCDAVGISP